MSDFHERVSHTSNRSTKSHRSHNGRVSNPLFAEVATTSSTSSLVNTTIPIDEGDPDPSLIRSQARNIAMKKQAGLTGCLFIMILGFILYLCSSLIFSFKLFGSSKHHHHHHKNDIDDDTIIEHETPSLYLVETIPLKNFSLPLTPNALNTFDALIELCNSTTKTLDISVMYWNLLVNEDGDDVAVSSSQACAQLGCNRGQEMYEAFGQAARRGVNLRFLQDNTTNSLGSLEEIKSLIQRYPTQVSMGLWDANQWYGGGIMHMKLWVSDSRNVYIGSANMDWLSLAQVKEMGVLVMNASQSVGLEAQSLFDSWWSFSSKEKPDASTLTRLDSTLGNFMKVPCWEPALNAQDRCSNPLSSPPSSTTSGGGTWYSPSLLSAAVPSGSSYFIAASPAALLGTCDNNGYDALQYVNTLQQCERTFDLDGIVNTIRSCKTSVAMSVMDFLPSNAYSTNATCTGGALWWPDLLDALTVAALANGCQARFLVSWWTHSDSRMIDSLKSFQQSVDSTLLFGNTNGSVTVGVFEVPGFEDTGVNGSFPPYSRVNHAKYVVTDSRANIGTSNYQPSYFYQTAGASFNTDDINFVASTQEAFDRDWSSSYTTNIKDFSSSSN